MMTTRRSVTRDRCRRSSEEANLARWLLLAVPIVAIAVAVAAGVVTDRGEQSAGGGLAAAPGFALPSTTGDTVTLDSILTNGDALVYFSMGLGCDGCFAQIPEIEDALTQVGIELVPIMVDHADAVASEAARFGISRPILVDTDRSVSDAYGMLGQFGHGDVPSHSFAYVSSDGVLEAVVHYPTMFVPADQLLADLDLG